MSSERARAKAHAWLGMWFGPDYAEFGYDADEDRDDPFKKTKLRDALAELLDAFAAERERVSLTGLLDGSTGQIPRSVVAERLAVLHARGAA